LNVENVNRRSVDRLGGWLPRVASTAHETDPAER
jgi:hypothetical protein